METNEQVHGTSVHRANVDGMWRVRCDVCGFVGGMHGWFEDAKAVVDWYYEVGGFEPCS
jgi:hypothetical protein